MSGSILNFNLCFIQLSLSLAFSLRVSMSETPNWFTCSACSISCFLLDLTSHLVSISWHDNLAKSISVLHACSLLEASAGRKVLASSLRPCSVASSFSSVAWSCSFKTATFPLIAFLLITVKEEKINLIVCKREHT